MQLKRVEGGLGVINLKDRLDAEALHLLALLLTEEVPQRRVLVEKVVNLPLGYASLLAHESLLKAWGTGSERWKAIAAAVMASPQGGGKAWWVPEGVRPKALSVSEVTPMASLGDEVVGELGDPRVRLLMSELCVGRLAAPLRQLRLGLEAGHEQPCKPLRREEREKLWGRKIDWKRTIARRDSHAVPAKARDVLLRAHCFNLQVGDRLKFLGDRAKCPHCGEAESVDHALYSYWAIQLVVGALKEAIRWFNPTRRARTLGDLLF
ncbi:unnamed protein product [Closterium sp. NIES-53]